MPLSSKPGLDNFISLLRCFESGILTCEYAATIVHRSPKLSSAVETIRYIEDDNTEAEISPQEYHFANVQPRYYVPLKQSGRAKR